MAQPSQQLDRWNTHFSTVVEQEVFGINFRLAQDPNSHHLGTTVWDASIVLAKYLEKNSSKGEFCRAKVKGKKAIELGSGMGLGGLSFALLGCDVMMTDVAEVLPLLHNNYNANLSPSALKVSGSHWLNEVGSVEVQELDWCREDQYCRVGGPYDYVIAADCVYNEKLVQPLMDTILAITHNKSVVLIVNEFRSHTVHDVFMEAFGHEFTIKSIPSSKQHPQYRHTVIQLFTLKRKKSTKSQACGETDTQQNLSTASS